MNAESPKRGRLRDAMPETAAWIDQLREVFGADAIDGSIRRGLQGAPTFWAEEAGQEVGTKPRWLGADGSAGAATAGPTIQGTPQPSPLRVKNSRALASG